MSQLNKFSSHLNLSLLGDSGQPCLIAFDVFPALVTWELPGHDPCIPSEVLLGLGSPLAQRGGVNPASVCCIP